MPVHLRWGLAVLCVVLGLACSSSSSDDDDAMWQTEIQISTDSTGGVVVQQAVTDSNGNLTVIYSQSDGTRTSLWSVRYKNNISGFDTPRLIENSDAGGVDSPVIAIDGSGNVFAVWRQFDGARWNMWANRHIPAGWEGATLLDSEDLGSVSVPQLVVDNDGNATVLWTQSDGSFENLWSSKFTPMGGWGAAMEIDSEELGDVSGSELSMDAAGNTFAVWRQDDGANLNAWGARATVGSLWGVAEELDSEELGDVSSLSLISDNSGRALAFWLQNDSSNVNLWAARFVPATGWAAAFEVDSEELGNVSSYSKVVDSSGLITVQWLQSDGSRVNLWSALFDPASTWSTPIELDSEELGDVTAVELHIDSADRLHSIWTQENGTLANLWASDRMSTGSWQTPVKIEQSDNGDALMIGDAVFDRQNRMYLVFQMFNGARRDQWAVRFVPGATGWENAQQIDAENSASTRRGLLVVDSTDSVTAVWRQDDGSLIHQWSNRYRAGSGWDIAEKIESQDLGNAAARELVIDSRDRITAIWPQSNGVKNELFSARFE